ncbi:leucine-rich PPR motif-containing protein, mitochondrial-like isoform X2 [Penaeus japonicus]|uniref:leucine-rich PPR motif-containing protein, mitochondrial-like isoform X2 n=1 Tax=Penaeus japonicus TaxID=27405 RepID=UPI001C716D04|nr:leucine-rich PPR motif-containing protein, mitochondrial-like isoform X2 [Penaeus japonicus]
MANHVKFLRSLWAKSRFSKDATAYHSFPFLRMDKIRLMSVPERRFSRGNRHSLPPYSSCQVNKIFTSRLEHRSSFIMKDLYSSRARFMSNFEQSPSNEASDTHSNTAEEGMTSIQNTFETLTMKLERLGSINAKDILRAVKVFEGCVENVTTKDYEKLLHMTLRMVEEEYRSCGSHVQRVWKLTEGRDLVNLAHIELYLRMCFLAEVPVNPWNVLSQLKALNLEPNRAVLDLFMLLYGWRGDIAGATNTLAIMKERDIPITETTFSSLIVAHGVNKDPHGIQSVLDTMRSVQMTPTRITYEALMTAYAISGSIAEVKRVAGQLKKEKISLSQSQLSSVLLSLIKSGQAGAGFENLDYIVELMEDAEGKMDLSRLVLQCIHSDYVREAIHLLPRQPLIRQNNHLYSNAMVYIREMVHARVEPELLVEMCNDLRRQEINQYSLEVALECALGEHRENLAWALIQALKMVGNPVRQHYFWPLLHYSALTNDSSKLLGCVKEMVNLGVTPDLETLRDHVIPGLIINHPLLTLDMLRGVGLKTSQATTPLLIVLIRNKMLDQCFEFVKEVKPLSLRDIIAPLASTWAANPRRVISLLAILREMNRATLSEGELEPDWGGQFVLDLLNSRAGLGVSQIQPLFEELHKHKIGISESGVDILMTRANKVIQQAIRDNLKIVYDPSLGNPPKEEEYNLLPHPNKMSVEELECHLVELRAKGLNTRGTLRRLLIMHASNNNIQRVLSLFKEAEADEVNLSGGMMSSIMATLVESGKADSAIAVFNELQTKYPSFNVDCYKVIDLCTLLVREKRMEDAVNLLNKYLKDSLKPRSKKSIKRNCWNLLMAAAENQDHKNTKTIFEILHANKVIDIDTVITGPLIKARLSSEDLAGAVKEAIDLYEQYKCLPMRIEILVQLILQSKQGGTSTKESEELLQSMLDTIVIARGSVQARHDLLFACLEAGQPSDAKKVLQNMGRNVDMQLVERQCDRYAKTEKDEPLLHFLSACRGTNTVDRYRIYKALLNLYYKQNAGEKGLSLWTIMQEDEVTPAPPFLSTLASLLAGSNIKIPFRVP